MAQGAQRLKDGQILRYSHGILGGKWKNAYAMLLSDSRFIWFDEKDHQRAKGSALLRNVIPYICVGFVTDRMPVKRPSIPVGYSIQNLVGIGMNARADPVHWFLFSSDRDIEEWFTEITKTFPKPVGHVQGPQGPQQIGAGNGGYAPPPVYPSYPPPAQPYNAPRPQYLSGQSQQPTLIYQDRRSPGAYRSQGGFGGLGSPALGLGSGLLAGSLLGYGLGSVFGGHRGYGGGPGFGGGYYSDNDTNITNNYYNYGDGYNGGGSEEAGNAGNFSNQQPTNDYGNANESSSWEGNQGNNDYGNANLGDYGGGMDYGDAGLSDFGGGGDFGGGDFGF